MRQPVGSETGEKRSDDVLTVVAIAIVAYALANLLHEAAGHGGACVAVGCRPQLVTSVSFEGDSSGLPRSATRVIQAAGTVVNLVAAAVTLAISRLFSRSSSAVRYFLWLFVTVNLLQATGYFLFSGVAGIGDWANLVKGLPSVPLARAVLAIAGALGYWLGIRFALGRLGPFIGGHPEERVRRATVLMVVPYVTGGVFYTLSGLLNPYGMILVFISAIAASFGGTSGLAWAPQLLRGSLVPPSPTGPDPIARSRGFLVAAVLIAIVFTAVLGPGVRLG